MTEKKRCFVIMPFSKSSEKHTKEYWTRHFDEFLKPRIEQSGKLEAFRSTALRGDILKEIICDLVQTPVVVADLTDHNPNVYWELGVRQSFIHGTITIAEEGTKLPFDLASKGTLFYPSSHLKDEEFEMNFQNALKDCFENPERPDSHVLDAISGRGTIYEIINRNESIRRLDALVSECKFNNRVLTRIKECILADKKLSALNFRYHALELIVTHRYIEQEDSFYENAEFQLTALLTFNERFAQIRDIEGKVGWSQSTCDETLVEFQKFEEEVLSIRKELMEGF